MQFSWSVNDLKWISNIRSIFKLSLNLINLFLVHLFYLLFFEKFFFHHHVLMEELFGERPTCKPSTSSTFFLIRKLNWIIALSIILCGIYKFQKIGFLKVSEYCAKLRINPFWNTGSRRRVFLYFTILN